MDEDTDLAKAGLDVLVVEAYLTAGGMTSTNPMAPEAPAYLINEASLQASLSAPPPSTATCSWARGTG